MPGKRNLNMFCAKLDIKLGKGFSNNLGDIKPVLNQHSSV